MLRLMDVASYLYFSINPMTAVAESALTVFHCLCESGDEPTFAEEWARHD